MGSLRSSVSQLEIEKSKLRTELADLQADHRRLEDQLAQEEVANGEMAARLDDARVLLRGQGVEDGALAGSARDNSYPIGDSPRTSPAGRSARPSRKPPFARIPGKLDQSSAEELLPGDDFLDLPPSSSSRDRIGPQSSRSKGSSSSSSSSSSWLPVARGNDRLSGGVR